MEETKQTMVGIVIASHSSKIAEGIRELAMQMSKKGQPILAAGGTRTGEIGTDPIRIKEAIEAANQGDGVIILADLDSAVVSVAAAKQMLDPALAKSVYLANAPIVEGTVAAAVEAAMGNSLEKVLQTAQETRNMNKE